MKSIAQFVSDGINSQEDLQAALQTAMRLEFSTIPPYLCAEWSIKGDDPDGVGDKIAGIVLQEMFHFALAGNMLAFVGGVPSIANSDFIVRYPTNELPGGVAQELAVDLRPLSKDQLQVFMQIEKPEFPPVALTELASRPATIGDFYNTIATAFSSLTLTTNANAHGVNRGEATRIASIEDALNAISLIKKEGEGTPLSPDEPPNTDVPFAHYYMFKEIFVGKTLVENAGFSGAPIKFPTVFDFQPSGASPNPSTDFNKALSSLLVNLQNCWTGVAQPNIGAMEALRDAGIDLITQGIRPEFAWQDLS
jgi:hypothetical protein